MTPSTVADALAFNEQRRPGITLIFRGIKARHPQMPWRQALALAKTQWHKVHV